MRVKVPAPVLTKAAEPLTSFTKLLLPVVVLTVAVVPAKAMVRSTATLPFNDKVALLIATPVPALPKLASWLMTKVPALISVLPAYVLTPDNVKLPSPSLTNFAEPLITSLRLLLVFFAVSIMAVLPVKSNLRAAATLPVKAKVAASSITTSTPNLPALPPKLASLLMAKVPLAI